MGSDMPNVDMIEETTTVTAEVEVEPNRDMQQQVLPQINLLDLMQVGADESEQTFGVWEESGNRCALGAMALGARKLGLI